MDESEMDVDSISQHLLSVLDSEALEEGTFMQKYVALHRTAWIVYMGVMAEHTAQPDFEANKELFLEAQNALTEAMHDVTFEKLQELAKLDATVQDSDLVH